MILIRTFSRSFNEIQELVGIRFLPNQLAISLTQRISAEIRRIVVEYPYVDKDYRDTYYNDFSKRHGVFDRNCVRLHFFAKDFTNIIHDLTPATHSSFIEAYRGFMILRDTKVWTIGRSCLNPRMINDRGDGFFALENTTTHVAGFAFPVKSFPWMQQDGNVTRCAHVALWSVIRFFTEKYAYYPEITLHQITEMLESEQRKNPSAGMTIEQIAQVLRDSRFYPGIYFKKTMSEKAFNRLLYIIIESGLPYIAALTEGDAEGHAIAIIGHGPVASAAPRCEGHTGIIDSCEFVDYLIASDDNYLPYTRVEKDIAKVLNTKGHVYTYHNISAVVVPYYEKMFLDVCAIFRGNNYCGCLELIERNYLGLPKDKPVIRRVLLTSSKSYKHFIVRNSDDLLMRNIISHVEMPKFIWLAEYSFPEEFDRDAIGWNVILDATAMNYQQDIFLAIRRRNRIIINLNITEPGTEPAFAQYELADDNGIRYTNNLEAM